ncbi:MULTISPECIES: DUF6011 domain-containing protein [Streptomyces]|uniref:DUF6011 domain-containing protein n=1 Tax=Streptomyces TaxID=1883 RepID=UPI00345C1F91
MLRHRGGDVGRAARGRVCGPGAEQLVTDPEGLTAPRCRLCGRLIHDQASRARGVGPVCARRSQAHSGTPASLPTPRATHGPPIPSQTELPLTPHQPAFWSP